MKYLVKQFSKYHELREKKLREFTANKKAIKIIVTTYQMMGITISKRKQLESEFFVRMKNKGYHRSEIWYFDEIIRELVEHVSTKGRHNTQLLQTIRMLKTYVISKNIMEVYKEMGN